MLTSLALTNATMVATRGVFQITQCISFSGHTGDCDTSKFQVSDLHYSNLTGTVRTDVVADFRCSAAAPCENITLSNLNLTKRASGKPPELYRCRNVKSPQGFECNT